MQMFGSNYQAPLNSVLLQVSCIQARQAHIHTRTHSKRYAPEVCSTHVWQQHGAVVFKFDVIVDEHVEINLVLRV